MNKPYLVLYPDGRLAKRRMTRLWAVADAERLSKEKGITFVIAYDTSLVTKE